MLDEILELYFEAAYRIIGRIFYGKEFSEQKKVPFFIKIISAIVPVIILVFIIWIVVEVNN